MILKPLSYSDVLVIANVWRGMGGKPKVEIGALEPLLWRDGMYQIDDLVKCLTDQGFKVSMTTNGQLLDKFANKLYKAGLSLIRTSWHSTDPVMFREISGGHGDYNRFLRGITLALDTGIKVAFNRVLFRGHTSDLQSQLEFIERYGSRLKLYTLMWTPQSASTYESSFQDWRPVVRESVLSRTKKIIRVGQKVGRPRIQFHLANRSMVEVKLGDKLNRGREPCATCSFKEHCEEEIGDYVRIDPRLHLYFCYMRRDLGFSLREYFGRPEALKQKLQESLGRIDVEHVLDATSLRLTVTPICNFNCRAPGAKQGWCMEAPGEYVYPTIRKSILSLAT